MHLNETTRPQALEPERPTLSPEPSASLGLSDPGQVTSLCELLIPYLEMEMIILHSTIRKFQYKESSQHSVWSIVGMQHMWGRFLLTAHNIRAVFTESFSGERRMTVLNLHGTLESLGSLKTSWSLGPTPRGPDSICLVGGLGIRAFKSCLDDPNGWGWEPLIHRFSNVIIHWDPQGPCLGQPAS